ncbi:MAG: hypothetical protein IT340_07740 [Chloroflexi bacterium]|nr:hypothetical protein [Chloroflexota bacterium]
MAAGQHHSLAATSSGAVWAWGSASFGQTGQGSTGFSSPTPVRVLAPSGAGFLDGIVAIRTGVAAGEVFSLALKADGTVFAWGGNTYGQLGDGTTTTRLRPVLVSGLSGATHLAAGLDFGVVRRADGTLRAWGRNDAGQLGAASSGDCGGVACSTSPLVVSGLSGAATAVAGGFGHSLTSTVAVGLTGGTTSYAYDRLSRLTGVTAPTGTTGYAYDPVGNRSSRTRTGTTTITYTYDRADRIKTVVQGATTTYTMNANGNLTARGNDDFTYDQANRLKTAVVGGVSSSAAYDGDGKRVSQTVAGITSRYVYDVGGGLPVLLDDGTRKYVWGLGLAYAVSGSSVEVYHTDGLGSVRALTDGAGALVQTQATDEFGAPTATVGIRLSTPARR